MVGRPYDEDRDLASVTRMWREVGWIDHTDEQAEGMRRFMQRGTALVADVAGEAECMVHRTPGSMRYVTTDLPLCAISGVTTSHVGRRQGLASALVVEALGAGAAAGDAVASLGFFEQGFYGAVHLRIPPVSFGLRLHDPLATMGGWPGVGGERTVHLGDRSEVVDGLDGDLPVLEASVGAFTRLWLGVRPATGLALTDDLHGPPALLDALDETFRLPPPRAGWSF
jgi:hypothetical protein